MGLFDDQPGCQTSLLKMQGVFMKRNIVFAAMAVIIGIQTFADENVNEMGNIHIGWPLFIDKADHTKLNFNSLFSYNRNYSLLSKETIFYNNSAERKQSGYKNSQENNWIGFLLVVAGSLIIWTDAYKNPLRHRYFESVWEHQQQEERMYRNLIRNND